jgi:invasion protein IalB
MTIRIVCAPARPVRWSLVTTVAAALALVAVPAVQAQAPAPAPAAPAAPANKPKPPAAAPKPPAAAPKPPAAAQQPAPPQQQQAAAPAQAQMPPFVYTPWQKICATPPPQNGQPTPKQICFTGRDARTDQGIPIVDVRLVEIDGEATKVLRIVLPFGLMVREGTQLLVDQNQPRQMPFVTCMPMAPNLGCLTQYEATPELVTQLKKGQTLVIQAMSLNNQIVSYPLALAEFAKANEGPPTDPKAYEEQQRKMQEDLQKKADELRKKLEQQQGTPPK